MDERHSALSAFARGTSGHSFGLDDLVDDVIYAEESGHLPNGRGLNHEKRNFVQLYYHYRRERRLAEARAAAGQL